MEGEEIQPEAQPEVPAEIHMAEVAPAPIETVSAPVETPALEPTPTYSPPDQRENVSLDAQREKARQKIASKRQAKLEKIIEYAKTNKNITNDDIEKLLHVSDSTAARYLKKLVKEGKLRIVGLPNHAEYEPYS